MDEIGHGVGPISIVFLLSLLIYCHRQTGVASSAAGKSLGAAKQATIVPIKVLRTTLFIDHLHQPDTQALQVTRTKQVILSNIMQGISAASTDFENRKGTQGKGIINISITMQNNPQLQGLIEYVSNSSAIPYEYTLTYVSGYGISGNACYYCRWKW